MRPALCARLCGDTHVCDVWHSLLLPSASVSRLITFDMFPDMFPLRLLNEKSTNVSSQASHDNRLLGHGPICVTHTHTHTRVNELLSVHTHAGCLHGLKLQQRRTSATSIGYKRGILGSCKHTMTGLLCTHKLQ